jgi:predicted 3-demethylubiquinone-9 3-methyltransferase (glyoxalase superfamily)
MPSITPHLWFDNEAREAAELYCSIIPNSKILDEHDFGEVEPSPVPVVTVTFELNGQRVIALNAGPEFKFNESFSFFVECDTQEEVDEYWNKFLESGGEESYCGWLKDRYGLSWQIIPKLLGELLDDPDKEKADRVMRAMLKMRKIECSVLLEAAEAPATV